MVLSICKILIFIIEIENTKTPKYIYIYIYIERERESRDNYWTHELINMSLSFWANNSLITH